ncbi:MAG TPA: hypothetical protein VF088_19445 [Pyrinomonadaceae bacterium]
MIKLNLLLFTSIVLFSTAPVFAQKTVAPEVQLLTRTTTRRETRHFAYGGTVTLIAAPRGSITVEGWPRDEVELTANIELKGPTEADLDQLAAVNTFVFDEDLNHLSVLTTGTHDRAFMKRSAKNFPKTLLNMPWKIDYRLRVPVNTDLEVNAGHGELKLSGVEGALRLTATESDTALTLTGGTVSTTVTAGSITLNIPARSWRGSGADIRVASGTINVDLPAGFSGDIDAEVLRTGKIVNTYEGLASREKPGITERTVRARAGVGGAYFKFTVGDGVVNIRRKEAQNSQK